MTRMILCVPALRPTPEPATQSTLLHAHAQHMHFGTETEPGKTGYGPRRSGAEVRAATCWDPKDKTQVHPAFRHDPEVDPRDTHRMRWRSQLATTHAASSITTLEPAVAARPSQPGRPSSLASSQRHCTTSVPALPAYYMPRPEQWDLRASLVNGVRGDGMVLGIVGASSVTGIAGTLLALRALARRPPPTGSLYSNSLTNNLADDEGKACVEPRC